MKIHQPISVMLVALTVLLSTAASASADTFAVYNGADTNLSACTVAANDCTLRGALTDSNATAGPNTITLPALRIAVRNPLPSINVPVGIQGVSARLSIIDGTGRVGSLLVSNFGSDTRLLNLEVTGARRVAGHSDAAVSNATRLKRVAIVDNQSIGLFADNTAVLDSLIARNTGEGVGGVEAMGSASISNSTIATNLAVLSGVPPLVGPLVWSGGVINGAGLMEIDHSTIAGNNVIAGAALLTGTNLGTVGVLTPSTVVRSSVIGGSPEPNCGGPNNSNGHNIEPDGSCHFTSAGDRSNVDPLLAPLTNNGGPTDTMALGAGSPAVDAGDDCPATDQRGVTRARGNTCDAGAFESGFTAAALTATGSAATATPTANATAAAAPYAPLGRGDTTPPRLTISRIAKKVTRQALRAGLKIRVRANEPIAAAFELVSASRRAVTARRSALALATLSIKHAGTTRVVKLKLQRALHGTRRIPAQLRATAFDAAGNRYARTIRFTIG